MVQYSNDALGKSLNISGTLSNTLGHANPLRYRGYYFDTETELYYVSSRYYDPETCRFLNADEPEILQLATWTGDILGTNLFTYAHNNPIMNYDPTGYFSIPSWTVSIPIDAAILWIASHFQITWMSYMAPLKFMGKTLAIARFKSIVAPALKGLLGTIVNVAVKALNWIGRTAYAASFNLGAKAAIAGIINEPLRAITALTSVGGLIAAIWDRFSDNKFDGWIKLW